MFLKKNNEGEIAMLNNNFKIRDCEILGLILSTTKKKREGWARSVAW